MGTILAVAATGTFVLYRMVTGSMSLALTAGVVMLVASLFFVAVSSYEVVAVLFMIPPPALNSLWTANDV